MLKYRNKETGEVVRIRPDEPLVLPMGEWEAEGAPARGDAAAVTVWVAVCRVVGRDGADSIRGEE